MIGEKLQRTQSIETSTIPKHFNDVWYICDVGERTETPIWIGLDILAYSLRLFAIYIFLLQ